MARDPRRYFNALKQADLGRVFSGFFDLLAGELPIPGGPSAERPPSGTFSGQTYFDTTAKVLLTWDGDRWIHPLGSSPIGVGLDSDCYAGTTLWTNNNNLNGGSSGNVTTTFGEVDRLGLASVSTGISSAAGRGQATFGNVAEYVVGIDGSFLFEALIRLPDLSQAGVEEYRAQFGFAGPTAANTSSLDLNSCVFFEYDPSTSPNWILHVSANNVRTRVVTTVPVSANWTRCMFVGSASKVDFYISAAGTLPTLVGTIAENIPTTRSHAGLLMKRIIKTAGTSNRHLVFDYFRINILWNIPRG